LLDGGFLDKIEYMVYLWDYDEKELKKTEKGRIFLLERMINLVQAKRKLSFHKSKNTGKSSTLVL